MAKELLTNLLVKYVKTMVPAWSVPDAIEFNAVLRAGHGFALDYVPLGLRDGSEVFICPFPLYHIYALSRVR